MEPDGIIFAEKGQTVIFKCFDIHPEFITKWYYRKETADHVKTFRYQNASYLYFTYNTKDTLGQVFTCDSKFGFRPQEVVIVRKRECPKDHLRCATKNCLEKSKFCLNIPICPISGYDRIKHCGENIFSDNDKSIMLNRLTYSFQYLVNHMSSNARRRWKFMVLIENAYRFPRNVTNRLTAPTSPTRQSVVSVHYLNSF